MFRFMDVCIDADLLQSENRAKQKNIYISDTCRFGIPDLTRQGEKISAIE